eukprot:CAMPEP_0178928684 /NCGR_PEP_ID=MMETSP0786-20121207/20067_1 /TAXON_ID=186022 /ORGANISM="Thalassionema frauenfeldii, Strain CCMP 1798" /LENGTH=70 /DNA_ID=CAMNT_0020604629 /DNA_START=26 /DNA_END=238 /DNA_ORIENTATION=+
MTVNRKQVSFNPLVTVRPYTSILDPVVKEQLYYSKTDLKLLRIEAKRIRWAEKLQKQSMRMERIQRRLFG